RGDRDRILDMIEMCDLLLGHASDHRRLAEDPVTQAAAQRWIEVLGEAATHVSDEIKAAFPDVAWREVKGIRVILAHGYFHIEQDIVSNVVSNEVPRLRGQLQEVLDSLPEADVDEGGFTPE
ncbi:MAG TPA: DUF86 domain-containing protein, partial [Ilumatobacteraceae bacterium]|nr:DUF86 domain-containing protein [Ilumatobacteraceae bacterium]